MENKKYMDVINDAFRSLALCFGGIFLIHPIKNEVIWLMMKSMEEIYINTCKDIEKLSDGSIKDKPQNTDLSEPHPAVEKLLKIVESNRNQVGGKNV